jgi:hypothetical protein
MTPILGIMASAISGNLWAPAKDYDSIATTTLSTTASSITFSSIPATYKHLQLRLMCRNSTILSSISMQFNSDTGANYARHRLSGDGATATAAAATSATFMGLGDQPTTASTFYTSVVDILDYANTNKAKTVRLLYGYDLNGSGEVGLRSNLWTNTSAITSIVITADSSTFAQYSSFALYGVK